MKTSKLKTNRITMTSPTSYVIILLSFLVSAGISGAKGKGDQCFCQLEGKIDDCLCNVDTVDYFNNMKIFPRLQSLLQKPYFRYFKYNSKRPCPFWDNVIDKCRSSNCEVQSCKPEEIPPGLKGIESPAKKVVQDGNQHGKNKYSKEANQDFTHCSDDEHDDELNSKVDVSLSESARKNLQKWQDHDNNLQNFCHVDTELCPDCDYVDLTINPERYTGYSGEASHKIWRAIYEENCFNPTSNNKHKLNSSTNKKAKFSAAFLPDTLEDMCLEKRAFYRAISGLHASITIHLCANYLLKSGNSAPFAGPTAGEKFGPNLEEFEKRFDPQTTQGQGPYWLKNLYFVYLLELRALTKVAPYLEDQVFFTGSTEEDKDTLIAVKELINLIRSFPDHFDETALFSNGAAETLKEEFRTHFMNISKIMDCVSCDKCKLWGKLQITGLGTALKILFSENKKSSSKPKLSEQGLSWEELSKIAEDLQELKPPLARSPSPYSELGDDFELSRNEIVALFNAFGRISTSIRQLERFREMLR